MAASLGHAGPAQGGGRQPAGGPTGVRVAPRKGEAVVWYNYNEDGQIDPRAVHCALPVIRGEKWAANQWCSITPRELLTVF